MLLDGDGSGPAILVGIAEAMQRADPGIADPGEDQLVGAAHADELVVDQVGRHPDQGQMPAALADDLVAGRERDEMGEALHGDGVAITDGLFHRLGQGEKTRHARSSPTHPRFIYGASPPRVKCPCRLGGVPAALLDPAKQKCHRTTRSTVSSKRSAVSVATTESGFEIALPS